MRTLILAALAALALTTVPAAADPCDQMRTQEQSNACAESDYKAATAEINRLYNDTLAKYDAKNQTLLRTAERAWITFRDAECAFRNAGNAGASTWPMVHFSCLAELTRKRIDELKAAHDCQAGDLTCNQNADSGAD